MRSSFGPITLYSWSDWITSHPEAPQDFWIVFQWSLRRHPPREMQYLYTVHWISRKHYSYQWRVWQMTQRLLWSIFVWLDSKAPRTSFCLCKVPNIWKKLTSARKPFSLSIYTSYSMLLVATLLRVTELLWSRLKMNLLTYLEFLQNIVMRIIWICPNLWEPLRNEKSG